MSLLVSLGIFGWLIGCHFILLQEVDYSPVLWFEEAFVDNWENVAVVAAGIVLGASFLLGGLSFLFSRRHPA
jgi:hypothetical protein